MFQDKTPNVHRQAMISVIAWREAARLTELALHYFKQSANGKGLGQIDVSTKFDPALQ